MSTMASDSVDFIVKKEPQDPEPLVQNCIPDVDVKQESDPDFGMDKPELINPTSTSMSDDPNTWVEESITSDENIDKDHNSSVSDEPDHKITLETLRYESKQGDYSDSSSNSSEDGESDLKCKVCKVCKEEFKDYHYLQQHFKRRRLAEKSYKCCGCEKIFRDNTQLNVHSRKHTGEQPYSCSTCGKKFSVNGNLSKHMRIHTGERRFTCDICDRKFTQFAHLEDHIKTHSGDRPYVCDFCNSSFKTTARLRKHRKSHDDGKDSKRSVPCPICLRVLKSTKQLLTHLETHDEGPHIPFSCDYCGKSYKNLFSLNIHLKSHGNVRDFKCSLCDKAFTNASHLRRHSNSHTGIRPFACDICQRGFPSSQNLKRHKMTHTGEKPFTCTDCNKSFLTLENLNRHKRTHTGEKPFPCDVCGRFFAHSTTAKEHMRVHTGDKPFQCEFCDKKFSLNKARYKHIREKHPEFFSEFKRLNDLPPNMKRAREKMKREIIQSDEPGIEPLQLNLNGAGGERLVKVEENSNHSDADVKDVQVLPHSPMMKCDDDVITDVKENFDSFTVKEELKGVSIKTECDYYDCS